MYRIENPFCGIKDVNHVFWLKWRQEWLIELIKRNAEDIKKSPDIRLLLTESLFLIDSENSSLILSCSIEALWISSTAAAILTASS